MNIRARKNFIVLGFMTLVVLLVAALSIPFEDYLWRSKPHFDDEFEISQEWSQPILTNETSCQVIDNYTDQFLAPMKTDWLDWSYAKTISCPEIDLDLYPKPRKKVTLDCSGTKPKLTISLTNNTRDIQQVHFGDKCLEDFINHCCHDDKPVPNVVHHVLFGKKEFGFFPFLSFMSAARFMKPCIHLIHGDAIPHGKYWDYFVSIAPNVIHVKSTPPTEVFGHKLAYEEHKADVLRIDVIKKYGGIYADLDEVLLKSIEPLRRYDCSMAELLETGYLGCMLFMAKKNSTFINYWKDGYKKYITNWGYNSQKVPFLLWKKYPNLVNVEGFDFEKPGMKILFQENYNWSTNWATHLAVRYYKHSLDLYIIRKLNVMLGAVSRHILLGDKELCLS